MRPNRRGNRGVVRNRAEVNLLLLEVILLGRPWQYDVDATHCSLESSYSFIWNNLQIVLLKSMEKPISKVEDKIMFAVISNPSDFVEDVRVHNFLKLDLPPDEPWWGPSVRKTNKGDAECCVAGPAGHLF
jgi:hypothetical protein